MNLMPKPPDHLSLNNLEQNAIVYNMPQLIFRLCRRTQGCYTAGIWRLFERTYLAWSTLRSSSHQTMKGV